MQCEDQNEPSMERRHILVFQANQDRDRQT